MDEVTNHKEITLAILPFENLTAGNESALFCKSFQIDLMTELSRFRQFHMIAFESLEDSNLQTDYIIKGSFCYDNDRLKINARLINTQDNHVTWADRFEGRKESLFTIQEDLLKEVVSTLQQQLNYDLLAHIRKKTRVSLTAYEHWLYGMEEIKKGSLEADEIARTHFQQAIQIDPCYSLAYSGMSMTYFNEWSCQLWDRWDVCQKGAFEWAKKAIELDEQNYVACCVLGRVYLYEGEYDTAEHYMRRALRLNPNDTDNMIQIASCFVYLGRVKEAEQLYQRVLQLNPLHSGSYHHIAALIAFELGEYKKAIAVGAGAITPWVDFPAMMAAAYFHIGDHENMRRSWQGFLLEFQKKILKGYQSDEAQALQWIINVSPYKDKTNLLPFWEYIGGKKVSLSNRTFAKAATADPENYFLQENDRWEIAFEGQVIHLTEVKGFYDLSKLLQNPEKEFHCTELAGGLMSSGQPVFDEKAKRSYQKKILELQEEIRWSENNNDLERTTSLQREYESIIDHLSVSLGIGKKIRKSNDPVEKARCTVTWRIRNAIQKIQAANPFLGKHLSRSIKTGLFCSYRPERNSKWLAVRKDPKS